MEEGREERSLFLDRSIFEKNELEGFIPISYKHLDCLVWCELAAEFWVQYRNEGILSCNSQGRIIGVVVVVVRAVPIKPEARLSE